MSLSAIETLRAQLDATHFDEYIERLESIPGHKGTLEKLVESHVQRWDVALQSLKPKDLTVQAVESAIQRCVQQLNIATNDLLTGISLGTTEGWQSLTHMLMQIVPPDTTTGYFLKPEVLHTFLRAIPPTTVLQHLGYASIDECLEKESVFEIMAALRFAETEEWMERYLRNYGSLTADSFEIRQVKFLMLNPSKWWKLAEPFAKKKKHHFSHLKEVGVVFSYPAPDQINHSEYLHVFVMMILHYIYEVKFYAEFFQRNIHRYDDFGNVFIEILRGDINICSTNVDVLPIVQQYHLKKPNPNPCVFQPHVMPEVLHWHKARKTFFALLQQHPDYSQFTFWNNSTDVASFVGDELVTLNFADNILSREINLVYHYKEDLWNSIFNAYFSETILEEAIIHNFADKTINLQLLISKHYGQED